MADLSTDEKLVALGLKSPATSPNPYRDLFQQLRDARTFSAFRTDVQGLADYPAFETYLADTIGMAPDDATRFRTLVEQKHPNFTNFQSSLDNFSTWDGWEADFKFGDTFGSTGDGTQAGVRVHAEPGVSYDGVALPKGTVEVFAPRIEFSETPIEDATTPDFSYTNITVSDDTPNLNQSVDISCDVTNETVVQLSPMIRLLEEGEVVDSQKITIDAGAIQTVTFSRSWDEYVSVDLRIESSPTVRVVVEPKGIV